MWIVFLIGFIFLFSLAYAAANGAPWVPTWQKDFSRIERLLNLQDGETFMELGCGNGRVCRAIAKCYPSPCKGEGMGGVCVIGIELSLLQFLVAWIQTKLSGLKNVSIKFGNAFNQDLSKVDALYMFLMPETYAKIRPKLEKELKSGARVVTYVWPIAGWEADEVDEVEGRQKIYLYKRK